MIISTNVRIPFPRPLVYATYRDKIVQLVPYMPNVRKIEIKSRYEEDGLIHLVNEWHGGGEIPLAARAFLSEELLAWTEHITWKESEFTAEWRSETHTFAEAVHCTGKNRFLEDGSGTVVESRGKLAIDTQQIKGIPHLFRDTVGRIVEEILSQRIEPNLLQMGEGVRQYLQAN